MPVNTCIQMCKLIFFSLLKYQRKINMDQFRQRRLPDAPTLFPLPKSSPKTMTYTPVNFDKLVDVDPEKRYDYAKINSNQSFSVVEGASSV